MSVEIRCLLFLLLFGDVIFAGNSCKFYAKGDVESQTNDFDESVDNNPDFTNKNTIIKLYQLMKDVHEVLVANNIEYWVVAGTLLGAVRHKGIIPWDDDLDICVKKSQINDFVKLGPVLANLGYELIYFGGRFDLYRIFPKDGLVIRGNRATRYPFMDVFTYVRHVNKISYGWAPCNSSNLAISIDDLYPIKDYAFGEFFVRGPNVASRYLEWAYGSDFMDVAYCGFNHCGKRVKSQKMVLSDVHRVPAQPTGPLKNNVSGSLSGCHFCPEITMITRDNIEEVQPILEGARDIFLEAFEKQAENQLHDEDIQRYEVLSKSGRTVRDILIARFDKIIEVIVSQIDSVEATFIEVVKNSAGVPVGYAIFIKSPIKNILKSMILRKYIKSLDSLSEDILNAAECGSDLYIVSMAVLPSFQNRGNGKNLIFSAMSNFPEVSKMYLLTAASKTNIATQQFYEHSNFQRSGTVLTSDNSSKIIYRLSR